MGGWGGRGGGEVAGREREGEEGERSRFSETAAREGEGSLFSFFLLLSTFSAGFSLCLLSPVCSSSFLPSFPPGEPRRDLSSLSALAETREAEEGPKETKEANNQESETAIEQKGEGKTPMPPSLPSPNADTLRAAAAARAFIEGMYASHRSFAATVESR